VIEWEGLSGATWERTDSPTMEAVLALEETSDESKFLLATMRPTSGQRRLALAAATSLFVAFCVSLPFMRVHLPPTEVFIPTLQSVFFLNDLITAVLLFAQFSIGRSRAVLILASGYLFAALIVIPFLLTFPGAFSPARFLSTGLQSAAWLYGFWHFGFAAAVLSYAWLNNGDGASNIPFESVPTAIRWSVAIVVALVCGLTWLAMAEEGRLPRIFYDKSHMTFFVIYVAGSCIVLSSLAFALLWIRGRSLLDQWLMVVALATISELMLSAGSTARFDFGFYAGRVYSLVTSVIVLAVLIAETTRTNTRLVRSNLMLQRERNNKMMNLAAVAASISHEVRQPLMSIAMNGGAALQFLVRAPPNVDEARLVSGTIVSDSHRASQILDGLGGLFIGDDQRRGPLDLNGVVLGTLHILRGDLEEHGVLTRVKLAAGLPHVIGNRGQLEEVVLNLVNNAIEAMDGIKGGARILHVRTERHGREGIAVTIEDSGPGMDPTRAASLFDAFVTTKPDGIGLGLAICQMIVERHGGQLSTHSGENGGASLRFVLPLR
jgi:signal transduction histidine kinase